MAQRTDLKAPVRLRLLHRGSRALVFLLSLPIRLYRLTFSRLVGQVCRFHPSCSRYALDALDAHGPLVGPWLIVKRLARCQPFCQGGLDPVPPPKAPGPRD